MEKEFVPYEIALTLKELGFDEVCFVFYLDSEHLGRVGEYESINSMGEYLAATLYQQAFRWFREEHNIEATISCFYNDKLDIPYEKREYHCFIVRKGVTSKGVKYKTNDEAQDACLKKLIEIVNERV